jgi:hypothetical protein
MSAGSLHRSQAEVEAVYDLFGNIALSHQLKDLTFEIDEGIAGRAGARIGADFAEEISAGWAKISATAGTGFVVFCELGEPGGFRKSRGLWLRASSAPALDFLGRKKRKRGGA